MKNMSKVDEKIKVVTSKVPKFHWVLKKIASKLIDLKL